MEAAIIGDLYAPHSRIEISNFLTGKGYKISATTLATMATRGGGPPFRKWGKTPIYLPIEALEWAEARVSAPCKRSPAEPEIERVFA